jgi:hypothetical protein
MRRSSDHAVVLALHPVHDLGNNQTDLGYSVFFDVPKTGMKQFMDDQFFAAVGNSVWVDVDASIVSDAQSVYRLALRRSLELDPPTLAIEGDSLGGDAAAHFRR